MTGHKYLLYARTNLARHALKCELGVGGNEKMEKRKDVKREFECHIFEENGVMV